MSQDILTKVTIPPITIYKLDINRTLKPVLAFLAIFMAVALLGHIVYYEYIPERYNAILSVWVIPFLLSIVSSILLAVLLNWQNAKIENSRLVMIRNEALVPVFYELSVYFAKIAKCAVEESCQRGEKIYDERHSWQEWVSILYELLNEFDINDYKIWDRKEKYTNTLNDAAEQACGAIDNFCSKKDTMRLFSVIQRKEYSQLLYIRNLLSGRNGKCFDDAPYLHESLKVTAKYISEALEVFPDFAILNTVSFGQYGLYFEECSAPELANKNVGKARIVRCKDFVYRVIRRCYRCLKLSWRKLIQLPMMCVGSIKKLWQKCKFVPDSADAVSELTTGCVKVKPFKIHNDGNFALLGKKFAIVLFVLSVVVLLCFVFIMRQSSLSVGMAIIDFITLLFVPFVVGIFSSVLATIVFTRKDLREKNINLYERRKEAILPIFDALAQFYTEVASIVVFNNDMNTDDEREELSHRISTFEKWTSLFCDIQNKRMSKLMEAPEAYRSIKDDMSKLEFPVDVVIGCIEKFEQNVEFYKSEKIVSLEEASSLTKIKRLFMRMRQYQDPVNKCKYLCLAFRRIKLCVSTISDFRDIENTEFGVDGLSFTFDKLY